MRFLSSYIDWHYFEVWPRLLVLWRNLALFPFYYFSLPLHLSTLFYPWKRQTVKMGPGFHFSEFLSVVSFNLISRTLGAIIRLIIMFYGLFFMLLFLILSSLPVLIWTIIPFLTIPLYLARLPEKEEEVEYYLKRASGSLLALTILLLKHREGQFVTTHLGLDPERLLIYFSNQEESGDFALLQKSLTGKKERLRLSHLFEILAKSFAPLRNLLEQNHLKSEDVYQTALWFELLERIKKGALIFDLARIKNLRGVGCEWAYGYTVEFDKFADDITSDVPTFPLLVGREKELRELERILIETEGNNALIVGEPGVARHLLVETLAYRILSGNCLEELSHKRILSINMHSLTSAKPTFLEVKGFFEALLEEARNAGNIIVFIDEIDRYLTTGEGRTDLSDVITKFAQSNVGLIGITTQAAYHKYIETNSTVARQFEKVELAPPANDVVLAELEVSIVPVLEQKHKITITYPAIKKTIENADRYISATPYPAKAIEILDSSAVFLVTKTGQRVLLPSHIDEFLSEKLHIPLGELQKVEKEKLAHLENLLHQRVIDQEEAIRAISAALRRARLNVSSSKRPIGSFLFLGPTGVGKTETAKALASVYFGSEEMMHRFDMSSYQEEEGQERLIGSVKLGTAGELTSCLRDRPFGLLLLDEFEKSDKEIFNLFLTLIDEGYITDATGKKVDARNTIIIATSNAGAEHIRECINQGATGADLQKELIEYIQREQIFSPELLNRFDAVIVFTPLTEGHLREVARLMLADLNKRLQAKEVSVTITPELIRKLSMLGFDPQFGARAMRRVIAEKIEDQVAQRLLAGDVRKGEKIEIKL